jgi:DNA-binding Xre family transcriptional regulator
MKQKQQNKLIYSRIMLLKKELAMGQNEFCAAAKISSATYHAINTGADNVRQRTLRNICDNLKANPEWVFKGEGEKFMNQLLLNAGPSEEVTLMKEMYRTLEGQLQNQIELVTKLTNIIMQLSGNTGTNFLRAFNKADSSVSGGLLEVA